jgi:signal transduction histidine kinase
MIFTLLLLLLFLQLAHEINAFPSLGLPGRGRVSVTVRKRAHREWRPKAFKTRGDMEDGQQISNQVEKLPPIPVMPSQLFIKMAHSQFELLANSLVEPGRPTSSKIDSMALYLPQENVNTGQLEFTPAVLYPDPSTERVFIASDSESKMAPTLPKILTKLPGFAHATTLLPGYPMISSDVNPGVGVVEEMLCDARSRNKALTVPLLSGSQTVGVLLVSPSVFSSKVDNNFWTEFDRKQVSVAAQSLSMALSMDSERNILKAQNRQFREGISDSLHQIKNPLQALRTYGKLLQRRIANVEGQGEGGLPDITPQLIDLTENLMTQSKRVVDLLVPMDTLVDTFESPKPLYLNPAKNDKVIESPLVLWQENPSELWATLETEILEFARDKAPDVGSFSQELLEYPSARAVEYATEPSAPTIVERPTTGIAACETSSSTMVGDIDVEMTFVTDLLEPIFSVFQAIGSERGIDFEVIEETTELPGVMVAPKSLQEAVCNVLDNAFKYVGLPKSGLRFESNRVPPSVRVRLFANIDPLRPGVTILVEDNGPGIAAEDRDAIFERGYRSKMTNSIEGSGIGLDICQSLMKRMGGVLTVGNIYEFRGSLDGALMKFVLFRNPPK